MNKYTIHCTEEQTKKAFELGAPIIFRYNAVTRNDIPHFIDGTIGKEWTLYFIPTAEQMIGWLEEQESITSINIDYYSANNTWAYWMMFKDSVHCEQNFISRKEATLAAIDAALDYLTNKVP